MYDRWTELRSGLRSAFTQELIPEHILLEKWSCVNRAYVSLEIVYRPEAVHMDNQPQLCTSIVEKMSTYPLIRACSP